MDKIDEFFKVDATLADRRPEKYEHWRTGLHWTAVGFLAIAGGLGAELGFGLEAGADVGISGMGLVYLGGGYAAFNLIGLRPK